MFICQVGPYAWLTYQEVYHAAIRFGSAIRSRGVNPVSDKCFYIRLIIEDMFDLLDLNVVFPGRSLRYLWI